VISGLKFRAGAGEKASPAKQKNGQKESFAGCDDTHFSPLLQTEGNPVK
jgi:hypothetical protein